MRLRARSARHCSRPRARRRQPPSCTSRGHQPTIATATAAAAISQARTEDGVAPARSLSPRRTLTQPVICTSVETLTKRRRQLLCRRGSVADAASPAHPLRVSLLPASSSRRSSSLTHWISPRRICVFTVRAACRSPWRFRSASFPRAGPCATPCAARPQPRHHCCSRSASTRISPSLPGSASARPRGTPRSPWWFMRRAACGR